MWCQIRYWQQTWKLEDEILTKHHYPDTRTRFTQWVHFWEPRLSLSLSVLLLSSHNIVLQCDIKYLQDESAGWSRRVCDSYLGIDSRPRSPPVVTTPGCVRLVTARVQAKAGLVMRTLTRNARHSDRRLSYSDSLLSHAQNLTFVLGHYFPNSSRRNIYFLCNTDCLFKIDPFNYLSRLVMFFSWTWKHK